MIIWLTGLPGSGKTTISNKIKEILNDQVVLLDGDRVRKGICKDLGFSNEERVENIRRVTEMACMLEEEHRFVLVALVSPLRSHRTIARQIAKERQSQFAEVFIKCPVEICKERDPKGMYAKAATGKIKDFTGVSAPYEEPEKPELVLDTLTESYEDCVLELIRMMFFK